jgi:rhamnosyltransferase
MNDAKLSAIIVTYFPDEAVPANLTRLAKQVPRLIVVDNGSPGSHLKFIRKMHQQREIELIENGENLGIAAALNRGIALAGAGGAEWVILFDQDSNVTDGFMDAMISTASAYPHLKRLAIVTPKHIDPVTKAWRKPAFAEDGTPFTAMTSGSLMQLSIFDRCGWFAEDFFIDRVDDEYCLRLREHGMAIVLSENAILYHQVGSPKEHYFLGIRICSSSHHSAFRRYFITRNRVVMIRRYWRKYPLWSFRDLRAFMVDSVKLALVEEDRGKKLASVARGIRDGVLGRMGPGRSA